MVTAVNESKSAFECTRKGAEDYPVKPFMTSELIKKVRDTLGAPNERSAGDPGQKNQATGPVQNDLSVPGEKSNHGNPIPDFDEFEASYYKELLFRTGTKVFFACPRFFDS
jgi:response regulator RpfG family c-di-GMP phosphodiesterase